MELRRIMGHSLMELRHSLMVIRRLRQVVIKVLRQVIIGVLRQVIGHKIGPRQVIKLRLGLRPIIKVGGRLI